MDPAKLALAGFAFRDSTPEEFVDFVATLGLTGIDYWPWNGGGMDPAEFRDLAASVGLRVVAVNMPSLVTRVVGPGQDDAAIVSAMDDAVALGAPAVQVYAAVPDEGAEPADALAAAVAPLLPAARDRGLTLLVENNLDQRGEDPHGRNPSRSPSALRRAFEATGDPAFRLCFDPANFVAVGEEPLAAYRELRPHVGAVHVKDCRRFDPALHDRRPEAAKLLVDGLAGPFLPTVVGAGAVPWPEIAAALASDGYDGWVTVDPFIADELLGDWCRDSLAAWRRIDAAVAA